MAVREIVDDAARLRDVYALNVFARAAIGLEGDGVRYRQLTLVENGAQPRAVYNCIVEAALAEVAYAGAELVEIPT